MLHIDDVVEEIATKRQGKIASIGSTSVGGEETQNQWQVRFTDGEEPPLKYFMDATELRLVHCPHGEGGEAGFYPSTPIQGW